MGQIFSCLHGFWRRCRHQCRHALAQPPPTSQPTGPEASPPASQPASQQSTLVRLPAELLLEIAGLLLAQNDVAGIVALSLTCKALYGLLFHSAVSHVAKESPATHKTALLQLLERDWAGEFYFCERCPALHPFSSSSSPRAYSLETSKWPPWGDHRPYHGTNPRSFNSFGYRFAHFHGRLVMNRRLFGNPIAGLPLHSLTVKGFRSPQSAESPWTQDWTARIAEDELLLQAIHRRTIPFNAVHCVWKSSIGGRPFLNVCNYEICNHLRLGFWPRYSVGAINLRILAHRSYRFEATAIAPDNGSDGTKSLAVLSCRLCLTDFDIEVDLAHEREEPCRGDRNDGQAACPPFTKEATHQPAGGWSVTITAYHRLGQFRSLSDPKWTAFEDPDSRIWRTALTPNGSTKELWEKEKLVSASEGDDALSSLTSNSPASASPAAASSPTAASAAPGSENPIETALQRIEASQETLLAVKKTILSELRRLPAAITDAQRRLAREEENRILARAAEIRASRGIGH